MAVSSDPISGARWRDCKHFRGIQAGTCEAGVVLRDLVGGPRDGWCTRLPCLGEFRSRPAGPTATCDLFALRTKAEIAAEEAELAEIIARSAARFEKLGPVYEWIRRNNEGVDAFGTLDCPVCGGTLQLHWKHAGYNGHVWLACKTDDCVRIIE